jgi:hypothetical protein
MPLEVVLTESILDALLARSTENHRAKVPVAHRQGFDPLFGWLLIPHSTVDA